ncbi:uncharacterized protein LOC128982753 [Macrosteles quadrilineatus]|uniref:uncharacterized protein LOC128982753 n=1 Tax=Macrosteles quadrilineatus TaxID=74068 RepID=UPI0023E0A2CF|nr:uncharacterized protein LOC128982753 [Macrosteles quadrilineatus]
MGFRVALIFVSTLFIAVIANGTKSNQENNNIYESQSSEHVNNAGKELNKESIKSLSKKCFVPTEASRIRQIGSRLNRAQEKQTQQELDLVLATTKLAELEKLKDTEKISDSTPTNNLTSLQRFILSEIATTKAQIEDLTVEVAVGKTSIEQLKIILVANGGSVDTISKNDIAIIKRNLENRLKRAQVELENTNTRLATMTSQVEQLESEKTAQNINTDNGTANLTHAQRRLLGRLESAKKVKYGLTLQSAMTNERIQQFQLQINELTTSSNEGTGTSSATTPVNTGSGTTNTGSGTTNTGSGTTNTGSGTTNTGSDTTNTGNQSTDSNTGTSDAPLVSS